MFRCWVAASIIALAVRILENASLNSSDVDIWQRNFAMLRGKALHNKSLIATI
jgi:hypothetical protein